MTDPILLPLLPSDPFAPVTQTAVVVVVVLSVYVITDLVQIYLPFAHPGYFSDQLPPDNDIALVD